ncbi:hypothetical protein IGI04_016354 [Brassica rapa subsp. trilocularis]|uniref:PSII 6.1 kDa protein n=1 Tax=Brassica rapa subsp. trilocularis TaxID=1813537 RepID=A0ABQ7MSR4_BRACM|nr:hypothetical protein IGI04_016354 [Brassica rapa subsp. trilocularis]
MEQHSRLFPPLIESLSSIQKANTSKGCVVTNRNQNLRLKRVCTCVGAKERLASLPASTVSVARPALLIKPTVSVSAPVLGLPPIKRRKGGVRCSMEPKQGNVSSVGG